MARNRLLRQRPLPMKSTPSEKMRKELALLRRKKVIRQLVIDCAHRHGIELIGEVEEDHG